MSDQVEDYAAAIATLELPSSWTVDVVVESRETIGLNVAPGATVSIRVSPAMTAEYVAAVVGDNLDEIADAVEEAEGFVPSLLLDDGRKEIANAVVEAEGVVASHPVKPLVDGTVITVAGTDYRLQLVDGPAGGDGEHGATSGDDGVLRVRRGSVEEMAAAIGAWLCSEGQAWARAAGREYERRGGIVGLRYEVCDLPDRWAQYGSDEDGRDHEVVLNWVSLGLPYELLEYVLVHELGHAMQPEGADHGAEWRAQMDAWMPDWRERRSRLNQISHTVWLGDVCEAPE